MEQKKKSLSTKIVLVIMIILLVFTTLSSIILYKGLNKTVESSITNFSTSTARNVADQFDVVKYKEFLENPTKENPIYWNLREELNQYRLKTGAKFVYTMDVKDGKEYVLIDGAPSVSSEASDIMEETIGDPKELENVYKGQNAVSEITHDKEYGTYLSAFAPIQYEGKIIGVLGVDIDVKDIEEIKGNVANNIFKYSLIINGIVMAVSLLFISYYVKNKMRPLKKLVEASDEIAKGDMIKATETMGEINLKTNDEVKVLADSFEEMLHSNKKMVSGLKQTTEILNEISDELVEKMDYMNKSNEKINLAIGNVDDATTTQIILTDETLKGIESNSEGMQEIAETINDVNEYTIAAKDNAHDSHEKMSILIKQIDEIDENMESSNELVLKVSEQIDEINNMADLITEIANQTNLIALNASIEATRGGESAKGFMVVADEVKRLAEGSNKTAQLIRERLESFKENVGKTAKQVELSYEKTKLGKELSKEVEDNFEKIVTSIDSVTNSIQNIAITTDNQSAFSEEISTSFSDFIEITKGTSELTKESKEEIKKQNDSVEEIVKMSKELNEISEKMKEAINKYRI